MEKERKKKERKYQKRQKDRKIQKFSFSFLGNFLLHFFSFLSKFLPSPFSFFGNNFSLFFPLLVLRVGGRRATTRRT